MTPKQEEKLDNLILKVENLQTAIGGDERLKTKGVVEILNEHDKAIGEYKNDRAKIMGASMSVSALLIAAWHFIKEIFIK